MWICYCSVDCYALLNKTETLLFSFHIDSRILKEAYWALGEGDFSFVTACCNTETTELVAMKVNKTHLHIVHLVGEETAILKLCLQSDTCNVMRWNNVLNKEHICCQLTTCWTER